MSDELSAEVLNIYKHACNRWGPEVAEFAIDAYEAGARNERNGTHRRPFVELEQEYRQPVDGDPENKLSLWRASA